MSNYRTNLHILVFLCVSVVILCVITLVPARAQLAESDRRIDRSMTCANECHIDIWDRPVMHGPASTDCSLCHAQGNPEEHTFFLIAQEEELCSRCHTLPHESQTHAPVQEGACLDCHDPHGSDHPNILVTQQTRLCNTCHQNDYRDATHIHGPVAVGACSVCHEAHSSPRESLLRDDSQQICMMCHAEVLDNIDETHVVHEALNQDCTGCHDPHASDHRFQLQAVAPELCSTCHQDVMEEMMQDEKVIHGVISEESGCSSCHAPHSSVLPKLLKTTQPDMCLQCHDDQVLLDHEGKQLEDIQAVLANNQSHHGPIRNGQCTSCHDPHSGDHFRLLVEDYPPEFYAPFEKEQYQLCFTCHISDLVEDEDGRGLTNFRDGDTNLHFLHVNKQKGRTCRACHEVHASTRPAHVRDAVPFGTSGWMLEINFRQESLGGSCAPACHAEKSYVRGNRLNIQPISPESAPDTEAP